MGRQRIGPRKIHGPNGLWFAVYRTEDGKTYRESLGTRDHTMALKAWPTAFQRLKDKANEVKHSWTPEQAQQARTEYKENDDVLDPQDLATDLTGKKEYSSETGELTDQQSEELAMFIAGKSSMPLNWEQAFEIHNKRIGAKRGRPITEKTKDAQEIARRGVHVPPLSFTVRDVQEYVQRLEDQELSANTISQRHGMMRAVIGSLIKKGHLVMNVWDQVECIAAPGESYKTATPEECKALWEQGNWFIRMYLYTGLRENELTSRHQQHVDGRWLVINEYDKPVRFRLKNKNSVRDLLLPDWCLPVMPGQKEMPGATTTWRKIKAITPECNIHSLRHAYREALRVAQVPTDIAERILGHAHKGQVGTYGVFSREAVEAAMRAAWEVMDDWVA